MPNICFHQAHNISWHHIFSVSSKEIPLRIINILISIKKNVLNLSTFQQKKPPLRGKSFPILKSLAFPVTAN